MSAMTDADVDAERNLQVACLTANEGVEQVELVEPRDALVEAGATVTLVAPEEGQIQAFDHLTAADTFPVEATVAAVSVDDFDALLLPGGVANPDALRTDEGAVTLIRQFLEAGKPVAVICHGPWTLVESDVVEGRTITSWPSLRTDLRNAGARWVDEEVVVCDGSSAGFGLDNTLVSSRKPDDLPAFCEAMVEAFFAGPAERDVPRAGRSGSAGDERREVDLRSVAMDDSPARGVLEQQGPIPEPSEPG